MILRPPLCAGGVNDTVKRSVPGVTDVVVGAPGRVPVGTNERDGADTRPNPTLFRAATVHE
jgi:hypothetical protein